MPITGKSVLLLSLGLVAGAFGLVGWRHSHPIDARRPDVTASQDPQSPEVDQLRREVASLKRMTMAQAIQAQRPASSTAAGGEHERPARAKPVLPPTEQRRVLTEALEGRLNGESVDPGWSAGRVSAIKTAFATAMPDVSILSADCATTLCKVVVQHTDSESQAGLMEKASDVEALSTETFFLFDKEATPPRTTLYMARAGEKLPRPQL
jgi:hypothetical protein